MALGCLLLAATPSEAGQDTTAPPRWATLSFGRVLSVEAKVRVQHDVRRATPAIGMDQVRSAWQDRRVGIQGTLFRRIEFEVSRELGDDLEAMDNSGDDRAWRDAYVDIRPSPAFRVQAGLFKLPFGHEELTGENNRDFVRRSLAGRLLAPGRDPGVMLHGRLWRRVVEYQVGYFTRDGGNTRTTATRGGRDAIVLRLAAAPFRRGRLRALSSLEIAFAVADSQVDQRMGVRGRSVFGDGVFFDRLFVNGRRRRRGLEAAWARGPVGATAEYAMLSDERVGMDFGGADLPNVNTVAWYAAGTWAVTGERKDGWVEPRHPVPRGGGAFEVAARIEALRFDTASHPSVGFGWVDQAALLANRDRAATLGLNWYLNHYAKLQLNVVREAIDDPSRSPAPAAGGRFVSTVLRLQFRL